MAHTQTAMLIVMAVEVTLNGDRVVLDEPSNKTLQELIEQRSLRGDRIAIERNGEIVPRTQWPMTVLCSGDRIEVVHFVGGGRSSSCASSATHRSP